MVWHIAWALTDHHLRRASELVEARLVLFRALGTPVRVAEALDDVRHRLARLGDHAHAHARAEDTAEVLALLA